MSSQPSSSTQPPKGQYSGLTPTDPLDYELDERGLPVDYMKWYKEQLSAFVDKNGDLWDLDRTGWYKVADKVGGVIVDEYSDKPLSGEIVGH